MDSILPHQKLEFLNIKNYETNETQKNTHGICPLKINTCLYFKKIAVFSMLKIFLTMVTDTLILDEKFTRLFWSRTDINR